MITSFFKPAESRPAKRAGSDTDAESKRPATVTTETSDSSGDTDAGGADAPTPAGASASSADPAPTTPTTVEMPGGFERVHQSWHAVVSKEAAKPYFRRVTEYVQRRRNATTVFPPQDEVYSALALTPFDQVKVVILGQDPYHGPKQAHGLAFSVKPGVKIPPSLRNMYKEIASDIGCSTGAHGNLKSWAKQGVLLLNTVLTVEAGKAHSHKGQGWETFTSAILNTVGKRGGAVFMLWGKPALKAGKAAASMPNNLMLTSPHPSPLSASRGFFGCKHFSKANEWLKKKNKAPIDWSIPSDE